MKHLIGLIDDRVPDIVSVYSVREERVFLLDATHGQDIRLVHEIAQTAWSCNENIATLSELFERDSLGKTAIWTANSRLASVVLGFGAASFLALPIKRDRMGIIPTHCDSDCLPVCATATTSLPSRIAGMQQQGGDLHLRTAKGVTVALDGEGRCCETLHSISSSSGIDPSSAVPVGVTAARTLELHIVVGGRLGPTSSTSPAQKLVFVKGQCLKLDAGIRCSVSVRLSFVGLSLDGFIARGCAPVVAVGALVSRTRRLAVRWLLTTLGGGGSAPVVKHLPSVIDDAGLDGRRGREDCVRWMKVEGCWKMEGTGESEEGATVWGEHVLDTQGPLKACALTCKSWLIPDRKNIETAGTSSSLSRCSIYTSTLFRSIPQYPCHCVATDSDPGDRLANKTSSGISLQDSDILAVLVRNRDEATSLVNAELAGEAAARRPELVPHQTAIILELESSK
ncbi:hypothetical protein KC368_g89 [Hortaea werneckii]|nr:hypothetical protein KC368_g89 [Hortaea werneckii]